MDLSGETGLRLSELVVVVVGCVDTHGISTCRRAVETVLLPMLLLILATSSSSSLLAISSLDITEPLIIAAGVRGKAGLALLPPMDS